MEFFFPKLNYDFLKYAVKIEDSANLITQPKFGENFQVGKMRG